jgi:ubiquitin C-terminal hydrolase
MEEADDAERVYDLFSIVIHIGQHLSRGHYISMVKTNDHWLLYDDDRVDVR